MKERYERVEKTSTTFSALIERLGLILTVLFTALRACDVIQWNWFWVMSPFIFGVAIATASLVVVKLVLYGLSDGGKDID